MPAESFLAHESVDLFEQRNVFVDLHKADLQQDELDGFQKSARTLQCREFGTLNVELEDVDAIGIDAGRSTPLIERTYFDLLLPDHPVFTNVPNPYPIGTPFLVSALEWELLPTASLLATAMPIFDEIFTGNGAIVANQTPDYRGLYFSHYIEDKADGANFYDMQTLAFLTPR